MKRRSQQRCCYVPLLPTVPPLQREGKVKYDPVGWDFAAAIVAPAPSPYSFSRTVIAGLFAGLTAYGGYATWPIATVL